jgi:tetratricopeptide (TPR) repeat protein
VGALAGALALAAALSAPAFARAEPAPVRVLPPRADARHEILALGATEWVRQRLAESGLASAAELARDPALSAARSAALPDARVLRALADAHGAGQAWTLDLQVRAGEARVRLLLVDLVDGGLAAAARSEAPLASLGEALAEATLALARQRGLAMAPLAPPSVAELDRYGRALAHLEAGRPSEAWRELGTRLTPTARALQERAGAFGTDDRLPLGERARLAVVSGEAERARLWLRAHLASSDDPALVMAAAESAEQIGAWERALDLCERALALDPASAAALAGRARALARLGRLGELSTLLARPLPEGVDPLALEPLTEPGLVDVATRARLHLRIAELAAARFDAPRAAEHFARASAAEPALEAEASRGAALLHASLGAFEPARAAAERAVALGGADAPVFEALAVARRRAGDAAGAKQAFEQARALAPEHGAALVGLAELAAEAGDSAQAVAWLREAVAVEPREPGPRVQLAGMLRGLGDRDGARAVLEGADLADAALLRAAAALRLERGETEPAATLLARAALLEPDDGALLAELAAVEERRGDVEAAAALRARAAADPASAGLVPTRAAEERPAEARAERRAAAAAASFSDLVATFPTDLAGRERRIEAVALLPPARDGAAEGWSRWLRLQQLDLDAVGRALAAALAERYQVVAPDEIPDALEAADQAALRAGRGDDGSVARLNAALGTDAVSTARVAAVGDVLRVELRMGVGEIDATVRRFRNEASIPGAVATLSQWNPIALGLAALALLLAALPLARGWGGLVVGIEYESLGKGFFSIRLSRRPEPAGAGREASDARSSETRYLRRMRLMGRYQRSMVDRETAFRFLPARRYFVQVHGLLQDPASEQVVGNYFAEQPVVVARGKTARIVFDFRPRECPVEVAIADAGRPAPRALVALRGQPTSVRYARGGRAILALPPGRHGILVGVGDRVLEREVAIEGFSARAVPFDVQDESSLVFAGCAEAVEPYLYGQLETAAEALERGGDEVAAARLRGELFAARGEVQEAARSFQEAGRFEAAAALVSEGTDPAEAALLYEQAGNLEKAAAAWRQAGEVERAGELFETLYRYEDALECWRAIGQLDRVCDLCEKLARNLDAAEVALEIGDADRAIRNLQMVELRDLGYADACRMLARIFGERGEAELSLQKLEDAVHTLGGAEAAPLELLAEHAGALERAGRIAEAIAGWEAVRARDFHWAGAAERLDSLRRALEVRRTAADERRTVVSAAPAGEGRYELLGEVGRGGMGVVFKARDRRLGRIVALKRLPEKLRNHPTAVRLFLREARAAAALNHRNIVTLHDVDQEGDAYFLTMEFLEGFPLDDLLARRGRLSPRDVARLGAQAAAGLAYAHEHGVVHRDIKTSNLFFTRDKVVKIMDFGLAKMTEEVQRGATVLGGTPYYMAPEQAAGAEVDARADLYAFGVTLYELLVGEVPFREGDVARHHRETPPPDPREKVPEVPPELAELVLALLAKTPEERPASAAEVGIRLQRIAKHLAG